MPSDVGGSMVNNLIIAALIISLVGMLTFLVIFLRYSNWHHSPLGRHMVYFAAAFSMALFTNLLRVVIDSPAIDFIRVVSLFLLAGVTWQRVYIAVKSLRSTRAK